MLPVAIFWPPFGELVHWLDSLSYRFQLRSVDGPETSQVRVVRFDYEYFKEFPIRRSPLDRAQLANVLDKIGTLRPRVVVVDIDILYRLRPRFEAQQASFPLTLEGLERLDEEDNQLVETINRLQETTAVVLARSKVSSPTRVPMEYIMSDNIYFGGSEAVTRTVDGVIYDLPLWVNHGMDPVFDQVQRLPTPSLALATWAAAHDVPFSYFLSGQLPDDLANDTVKRLSAWQAGKRLLVNWSGLADDTLIFKPLSAAAVTRLPVTLLRDLEGKIVVVGRTVIADHPFPEAADLRPTPYLGVKASGMMLQALFIDNLNGQREVGEAQWWYGLAINMLLSIALGCLMIAVTQRAVGWAPASLANGVLKNPLLSFALLAIALFLLSALTNFYLMVEKNLYAFSLFLIPVTSFGEALLCALFDTQHVNNLPGETQ